MSEDNIEFLRQWEQDIREATGANSVDADQLKFAATELERLRSELKQAKEIIGELLAEISDMETRLIGFTKDILKEFGSPSITLSISAAAVPPSISRARAFLKENENV